MVESHSGESVESDEPSKGFSLLSLILIFAMAGIGLSHVQTTFQLQKLQDKYQKLEFAYSKISAATANDQLISALAEQNIDRMGDLTQFKEDALLRSFDLDEQSQAELQTLLKKTRVRLGNNQ
ncbi:MAG: hypothetical protein P8J27_15850 [Mariniblastus sp.]|nr:hypothetical protein [Mariniblastus sp.]